MKKNEVTRTVISKSKTRLKGVYQEEVVYREKLPNGNLKSRTAHEPVKAVKNK
jgi:hypothetical protein